MSVDIPVGAYVASALAAANIPCDSGEDVDRFLHELVKRGYVVSVGHHDAGCELCAEGFKRGRRVGEMEGWADYTDKYDALLVAAVDARYETLGVLADDAKAGTPEAELAERVDAILRAVLAAIDGLATPEIGRASAEPRPDRADPERRAEGLLDGFRTALHVYCQPTERCSLPNGYEDAVIEWAEKHALTPPPAGKAVLASSPDSPKEPTDD